MTRHERENIENIAILNSESLIIHGDKLAKVCEEDDEKPED